MKLKPLRVAIGVQKSNMCYGGELSNEKNKNLFKLNELCIEYSHHSVCE